jgi:hypothetical protein
MSAEYVTAWATVVGAIAAIAAVAVANGQLKNLADSFRMSGLAAVLTMESEMNSRAEKMDEFSFRIQLALSEQRLSDEQIESHKERLLQLTDAYLNSVDRLAFCILKGYLPERDWRAEYEVLINGLIAGPNRARDFDNIVKLYSKWQNPFTDEYGEII